MPEVAIGSRGYKRLNKPINSCHILFIIVYSIFIILNYEFLYLLNRCIYYFKFMYWIYVFKLFYY